eukprot:298567_1
MFAKSVNCGKTFQVVTWAGTVINIILFISSLYLIVKYVIAERRKPENIKTPKCLLSSYIVFFIISSLLLLLWPLFMIDPCYNILNTIEWATILAIIGSILYLIVQIYLLWLVMFIKLYYVFKESRYALSKCTVRSFIALFIILPFIMFIAVIIGISMSGATGVILLLLYATFSGILSYLFVYKLVKIYKDTQQFDESGVINPNNRILSTITRASLLAFISFSFSLINPIVSYIVYDEESYFDDFISAVIMLMDIYTNVICVILTYGPFTTQYMTCCGVCDKQCKICLFNMISKQHKKRKRLPTDDIEECDLEKTKTNEIYEDTNL